MEKLYLIVTYKLKEGTRASFLREIERSRILPAIRAEEGCTEYRYCMPADEEDTLLLLEVWESEEAQQKHLKQPHMEILGRLKELYVTDTEVRKLTEQREK